jgi:hypothetical protein
MVTDQKELNAHLDFTKTFAFQNFKVVEDPFQYEFSDIDMTEKRKFQFNNVTLPYLIFLLMGSCSNYVVPEPYSDYQRFHGPNNFI